MKRWKLRTKDGIESEIITPGGHRYIRMCDDMSERVYRLEAFHDPSMPGGREFVYVEESERKPALVLDDPATTKRELENLKRSAASTIGDLRRTVELLSEASCDKQVRIAWLERELERLKPNNKKRGI